MTRPPASELQDGTGFNSGDLGKAQFGHGTRVIYRFITQSVISNLLH